MQIDRPITIAVILFIILLMIFFLVVPEYNTFIKLRTDLAEKTAEYKAEYEYYSAIDRIHLELLSNKEAVAKVDDALPKDSDLGAIIYYLQKTANDNGLIVKDLFLSKSSSASLQTDTTNNVKDIVFSMDLLGEYPLLEEFIISLEKSSRIFEVTNISFGTKAEPPYNFSLQIKTHSY